MQCDGLSVPDFQGSRQCQLIGFSNYWLNLLFSLYTVHFMMITQCFERTKLLLKMFKDAYMNCFYFLHIFSGAKNVTETGDPFCNTFCNLNGYYCKNSKNAVKIYDSVWWSYHFMKD